MMKIGEFARRLNITSRTVQRYADAGVITPERSAGGQMRFNDEHIRRIREWRSQNGRFRGSAKKSYERSLRMPNLDQMLD